MYLSNNFYSNKCPKDINIILNLEIEFKIVYNFSLDMS